jgi:hypothetical protein
MTVFRMSGEELSRLRIMIGLADGRLTVEAAAAKSAGRAINSSSPTPTAMSCGDGNIGSQTSGVSAFVMP